MRCWVLGGGRAGGRAMWFGEGGGWVTGYRGRTSQVEKEGEEDDKVTSEDAKNIRLRKRASILKEGNLKRKTLPRQKKDHFAHPSSAPLKSAHCLSLSSCANHSSLADVPTISARSFTYLISIRFSRHSLPFVTLLNSSRPTPSPAPPFPAAPCSSPLNVSGQ